MRVSPSRPLVPARCVLLLALAVAALGTPSRAVASDPSAQEAGFVDHQLIVRFHAAGPFALTECAETLLRERRAFRGATADRSDSLDRIATQLGVREARALFRRPDGTRFDDQRARLQSRLARAQGQRSARARPAAPPLPDLSHVYLVELGDGVDVAAAAELYGADPHVAWVQPNFTATTTALPDDPFLVSSGSWGQPYPDLWGLAVIRAYAAWNVVQGAGQVVAVVDSGLDYLHPDIAANVWVHPGEDLDGNGRVDPGEVNGIDDDGNGFIDDLRGFDFANSFDTDLDGRFDGPGDVSDPDPFDDLGHGTHVAGTIAATANNGIGIAGVAPAARIMALKGIGGGGTGSIDGLARAIVYAAENGADVINNSWSCTVRCPQNPVAEDAVRIAHALGSVVVFSAGNAADDVAHYSPQNIRETITVSATTVSDQPTFFTNFGHGVDIAAPGGGSLQGPPALDPFRNILSLRSSATTPGMDASGALAVGGDYLRQAGTSMSAPHVAGVAALIRSRHPHFSSSDVRTVLRLTADDLGAPGPDPLTGAGRVNALRAVLRSSVPQIDAEISDPASSALISQFLGSVPIQGTADGPDFQAFRVSWGAGLGATQFVPLTGWDATPIRDGTLAVWDARTLPDDVYQLRLEVQARDGAVLTEQVSVTLQGILAQPISSPGPSAQNAAISGDRVVWESSRPVGGVLGARNLFLVDLGSGVEVPIAAGPLEEVNGDISGNRITWHAQQAGSQFEVLSCAWDAATQSCPATTIGTVSQSRADARVSGNRAVWTEATSTGFGISICTVDPQSGACTYGSVPPAPPQWQIMPAIDGLRIAWLETNLATFDVRMAACELDPWTGACPRFTPHPASTFQIYPALGGNLLAWEEWTAAATELRVCEVDPATQSCPPLTVTAGVIDTFPKVSGRRIVWQATAGFLGPDVFFCEYDPVARACPAQRLTQTPSNERYPDIDGDRVVWESDRDGPFRIVMFELPEVDPVADRTVPEGSALVFDVTGRDPYTGSISLAATQADGSDLGLLGASFDALGAGLGRFAWTPGFDAAGDYGVTFVGTTPAGVQSRRTARIRVLDVNRPPIARTRSIVLAYVGASRLITACGSSDPDGDPLTFRWLDREGSQVGDRCWLIRSFGGATSEVFDVEVSDGSATSTASVRVEWNAGD